MTRGRFVAVFACWVLAQIVATAYQVPVWRSEPSLWAHAARVAPNKPRPIVNVGKAAMLQGRFDIAERAMYRALVLAEQSHLPPYDRQDAIQAAQANLQTISILRTVAALRSE